MAGGLGANLGPSALKWIPMASPVALNAFGSGNAIDCTGFEWGTVFLICGSTNVATQTFNLERSATSNGTFAEFGASIPSFSDASATLRVRSFAVNSSVPWVRYTRTFTGATSATYAVGLMLAGARVVPITQATNTCINSDVL